MAQRSKVQYKTLYGSTGSQFPDNTSGQITEGRMRSFGEDQADTFLLVDEIIGGSAGVPFVFIGNIDLSGDAFPTTGGTGSGGAIKKGNSWRVSVGTTSGIGGTLSIDPNSEIIALQDSPTLPAHWWIRI